MFDNGNGTSTVMPVSPMYGGGYGDGGFGGFGGIFGWIVLLMLCGFGGFGGWGGWGGAGGMDIYPWMNQADITTSGFQNAQLGTAISGVQSAVTSGNSYTQLAIAGLSQQVCNTGGNITAAINNGFSAAEIAANNRQIANMQQEFKSEIATLQGFNGLQSSLSQCCCDNRLATCQTQNIIQSDGAATRAAISAAVQSVLDKLCQNTIDEKNERILELQNRLNMADFAASQVSQNNYLQNALTAQTQYFLSLYPPPAAAARTVGATA